MDLATFLAKLLYLDVFFFSTNNSVSLLPFLPKVI